MAVWHRPTRFWLAASASLLAFGVLLYRLRRGHCKQKQEDATERTIRVGTWNVLSPSDEFHPSWGCPTSIHLCGDDKTNRTHCTLARYRRVWEAIDRASELVDVLLLQEVSHVFVSAMPNASSWKWVAREQEECAILYSTRSAWTVVDAAWIALPHLSGCHAAPVVTLAWNNSSTVAVSSLHVEASVPDMNQWSQLATEAFANHSSVMDAVIVGKGSPRGIVCLEKRFHSRMGYRWDL